MRELATAYESTRARIIELVAPLDETTAEAGVPACPSWSIRDVLAHLAGSCTDITTGNVAGAATDPWTAAQVQARKDRPLRDILNEWSEVAPQVVPLIDDFPGRSGAQMISDITVHEHDIRGVLGRPGARDSDGVSICVDFLITTIVHPGMTALGLGPLEIRAGDGSWLVGTNDGPEGDLNAWRDCVFAPETLPAPPSTKEGTVTAEPFELLRAATGRRSAAQIRRFDWSVDPEPYLSIFSLGPFSIRSTDLNE